MASYSHEGFFFSNLSTEAKVPVTRSLSLHAYHLLKLAQEFRTNKKTGHFFHTVIFDTHGWMSKITVVERDIERCFFTGTTACSLKISKNCFNCP